MQIKNMSSAMLRQKATIVWCLITDILPRLRNRLMREASKLTGVSGSAKKGRKEAQLNAKVGGAVCVEAGSAAFTI
jgi:hypothetical protein